MVNEQVEFGAVDEMGKYTIPIISEINFIDKLQLSYNTTYESNNFVQLNEAVTNDYRWNSFMPPRIFNFISLYTFNP